MRRPTRRRVCSATALAPALLAAGLGIAACGKYGPPKRPQPVAVAPAGSSPTENTEPGERSDGEVWPEEPSPEQSP